MTVLSACQDAIARLVSRRPASVFGNDDEICVEISSLANEAAADISKSNDWQALTEFYTITADGTSSTYSAPPDYDRMVQATEIFDPNNWCWGFAHVVDYGQWILRQAQGVGLYPGIWMLRKNLFNFYPIPAAGREAVFPYISNAWATSSEGQAKTAFDRDDDLFALDDRLLTLALIWRWKAMKVMDYQEDIRNYDIALSQAMARDKGSRVIRKNGGGLGGLNTRPAWPWELGGV